MPVNPAPYPEDPYVPPPGGLPPPGGAPPPGGGRPGRTPPMAGGQPRPPRQQQQPGYQQFSQYAQGLQANPTAYEQSVLGGQYLDAGNPHLQRYTQGLTRDFQGSLSRGLSQVSSPFMSGATLGQTGIHADTRGRYFSEGQQDLGDTLAGAYMDNYNQERNRQTQTSGDISGRTNQLVGSASSAYGADQQVRQARISADAALQQARMAQQLGYDELAGRMMMEYERLNQEAYYMEQQLNLGYAGLAGDIGRGFSGSTSTTQGPQRDTTGATIQGALGGGLAGYGAYRGYMGGSP